MNNYLNNPRIFHLCNVKDVSPQRGLFLCCWSIFSSILWVGCITFGIRALDSRVSLLQTCYLRIFAIIFFIQRLRSWNLNHMDLKYWWTSCMNFRSWFATFSEIWSEEVKVFAGSKIPSQTGDLGKIIITFILGIEFQLCKRWPKVNRV